MYAAMPPLSKDQKGRSRCQRTHDHKRPSQPWTHFTWTAFSELLLACAYTARRHGVLNSPLGQ
jgi:hypothetical protein